MENDYLAYTKFSPVNVYLGFTTNPSSSNPLHEHGGEGMLVYDAKLSYNEYVLNNKVCFKKFIPLVDYVSYLIGKYNVSDLQQLPSPDHMVELETSTTTTTTSGHSHNNNSSIDTKQYQSSIMSPHNYAYVDSFFYRVSSYLKNHHAFIHGLDFYDQYICLKKDYEINIAEDFEYVADSQFFSENVDKAFHFKDSSVQDMFAEEYHRQRSEKHKPLLKMSSKGLDDGVAFVLDVDDDDNEPTNEVSDLADIDNCVVVDLAVVDDVNLDFNNVDNIPSSPFRAPLSACGVDTLDDMMNEVDISLDDDAPTTTSMKANHVGDDDNDDDSDKDYDKDYDSEISNTDDEHSVHDDDDDDDSPHADDDDEEKEEEEEDDEGDDSRREEGDEEGDGDDDDFEDMEEELTLVIHEMPTQVIAIEKCEETLNDLLQFNTVTIEELQSCMFQVVTILYTYQKSFAFTHNDLHTKNIMYVETEKEYLYYCIMGKHYKVPTFHKIYKIIDFGRAIYTVNGKVLCSDSYSETGLAYTQYNCPPFYNKDKPLIEPNNSFDLCRLACSMLDYILDDLKDIDKMRQVPVYDMIISWLYDDHGKNVLYKKNGMERYPNFKLYKMIARIVHNHLPEKQYTHPCFASYEVKKKTIRKTATVLNIDAVVDNVKGKMLDDL